jgi:hypothetical protein
MTRILIENPGAAGQPITVNEIFDGFSVLHNLRPGENVCVALNRCQSVVIRGLPSDLVAPVPKPAETPISGWRKSVLTASA